MFRAILILHLCNLSIALFQYLGIVRYYSSQMLTARCIFFFSSLEFQ